MGWDVAESKDTEIWDEHWEVVEFFLNYITPMLLSQEKPSFILPSELNAAFDLAGIKRSKRKQMYPILLHIQTGAINEHVKELREKSK